MSTHEKKHRSLRVSTKAPSSTSAPNSTIIATPPRAALHGRSKADHPADDNASTKSTPENVSETDDQIPSHLAQDSASKDAKISELRNELATMEEEFERELTHLSHKLTNASETSAFWQQKHSALNTSYLKTDTDLRLLKAEVSALHQAQENQHEIDRERERDIKTRISSLILDRDSFREAYNEAMGDVRRMEEEVRKLQGQVSGLKSWVSSISKVEEQVTDEVFGEGMQKLGNGLQNWVITNFRRVRIDTEKAPESIRDELLQLIPTYEYLASTSKIHLIQSLVSRLLVDHIFNAYFVGLPREQAEELQRVESHLEAFGTAESMNAWRSTTLSILLKDTSRTLNAQTKSLTNMLITRINSLLISISDISPSATRDTSLHSLLSSAIDLSRLLRVQKAVFTVAMPSIEHHQQTMFDGEIMEDIGGEDEDTLSEREIRCVVFPGVVKSGDENGERAYLKNVVAKIRVVCVPD